MMGIRVPKGVRLGRRGAALAPKTAPPPAPSTSLAGSSPPESRAAVAELIAQPRGQAVSIPGPGQAPSAPSQAPAAPLATLAAPTAPAPVAQPRTQSRDGDKSGGASVVGLASSTGSSTAAATVSPSSPAPTAPQAPPATNPGTSLGGLSSSSPTNGRTTPEPTAFDAPATRTASAGSTATAAATDTGAGTRPGAGMGHGAPLIPPMGGLDGGAGGGSLSPRSEAPRVCNPEHEQQDGPAIVPGGTIGQKRPGDAA